MTGHEQHSYAARPAAQRGSVVAALAIPALFATACSTAYFGAGELNQAGSNGGATGGSGVQEAPGNYDQAAAQPRLAPPPRVDALNGADNQRLPREPESQTRIIHPVNAPLAPGTPIDISTHVPAPGEQFNYNICTVAYSFTDANGTGYAVTASHCGREGDLVWAGQGNNKFRWPAEPIGTFVYSDLYTLNSSDLDVAIIELNANAYDASLAGGADAAVHPMPTAIAERLDFLPEQVCKNGRITGTTCGHTTASQALGKLNTHDGAVLNARSARAALCATTGDSGGPVYTEINGEKVIVGLVSGTTTQQATHQCHLEESGHNVGNSAGEGISVSYTPATEFQRIINAVVPEAAANTETW